MPQSSDDSSLKDLKYERGEGRAKHRWKRDSAGFEPSPRGPVGKCHASIGESVAQDLLRHGVAPPSPYGDDHLDAGPYEIYNVYKGVPYVAVPTRPGISYHGYPWRGRMSPTVERTLRERATQEGKRREFDRWLREYEDK